MLAVMDTIGSIMRNSNVREQYCNLIGYFHFIQGTVDFENTDTALMFMFFQGVSGCGCYDIIRHYYILYIIVDSV